MAFYKKELSLQHRTLNSNAMKKSLIPLALLLLVFMGCNRSNSNSNEVMTELYTFSDSIFLENDFGEAYSRYTMNIDFPITNNDTLRKNIIYWMLGSENEDYNTYFKADMDRFFAEEGNEPDANFEGNYTLSEQTDLYVTYISEGSIYTGGAHPQPWYYGVSFNKADGSMLGYNMFEDPEQLIALVSENIKKQYFEPFNTEEEEYIFEPNDLFQLPTNQPWIETDSVVFCYGPFEIAPYAAGMPLCKISKEDLKPYLSEKGKSVFDIK